MGFIETPRQLWWRKLVFQIHLWVGVVFALYVVVISVSGCVLIFGPEITGNKDVASGTRTDGSANPIWDTAVAAARTLHPDYRLQEITVQSDKASVMTVCKDLVVRKGEHHAVVRELIFNPVSGIILEDYDPEQHRPVYSFIYSLHRDLLSGDAGRRVNGACAACLLLLCGTGIIIWWPGLRIWTSAFSVRWSAKWKRLNFDLHRAVGFWTLATVSVWAFTGISFGYPDAIRSILGKVLQFAANRPLPKTSWKPDGPVLAPATLHDRALQVAPGERIHWMNFPLNAGEAVYVAFFPTRSPYALHGKYIFLDPVTGEAIRTVDEWGEGKSGDVFLNVLFMLHFADFDCLPLRMVFALLELSPAVLAITGALMWWNRVLRKKWAAWQNATKPNTGGETCG